MRDQTSRINLVPIQTTKACDALADQLREMIISGDRGDGDSLPHERDLCERTGISRASVREALRILEADGLAETRPGRNGGTIVRLPQPSIISRPIELLLRGRKIPFRAVLEVREAIEPSSAGLAAVYRTDADIARLCGISSELEAHLDDVDTFLEKNLEWHMAIVDASHNELLIGIMQALSKTIFAATDIEKFNTPENRKAVATVHRKVEDAITHGDAAAASRRMGRHVHAYSERVIVCAPVEIDVR